MVLLKFYSQTCQPCKALSAIISNVVKDYPELEVVPISIDEFPEDAAKYGIRSVPTVILHNGEEVARKVGAMSEAMFRNFLVNNL